jgi:hypothetical protein
MFALYSDHYVIELPADHPFPIQKYRLVREQLLAEGTLSPEELLEPTLVAPTDVRLVHTEDYWERLTSGTLPESAIRRLGLPWSEGLVRLERASVQGTLTAARIAIRDGIALNLAGGTHHAFPDRGEGYCVLNDIAIATRCLQRDGWIQRIAIIDCDVHQGDGTATIFADEPDVYTFSIHAANNYPLVKVPGTLDIGLPDGTRDAEYLRAWSRCSRGSSPGSAPAWSFTWPAWTRTSAIAWAACASRMRACASAMSRFSGPAGMPASRWPSRWAAATARTFRIPWRPTATPFGRLERSSTARLQFKSNGLRNEIACFSTAGWVSSNPDEEPRGQAAGSACRG